MSAALKDIPTSIYDLQLAAIEYVRTIFENWQILESLPPQKPTVLPLIPRQAVVPIRHPTPTYKGGQEKQTPITSKGVVQQQVLKIPKNKQVTIKSKGDREPIDKRTISHIDSEKSPTIQAIQTLTEPIANRKISRTVTQNYTTP